LRTKIKKKQNPFIYRGHTTPHLHQTVNVFYKKTIVYNLKLITRQTAASMCGGSQILFSFDGNYAIALVRTKQEPKSKNTRLKTFKAKIN
jgi:hypothetical protein